MSITLSPGTEKLVNERVERGEFESASELVDLAVQRLLADLPHGDSPVNSGEVNSADLKPLKLKPLITFKGFLPPNWKDDSY